MSIDTIYEEITTETPEFQFATVAEVNTSKGLRLLFDGESSATSKYYKCNTSCTYAVGDRVKITKDSGTYVVDYVVGLPSDSPSVTTDRLTCGTKEVILTSSALSSADSISLGTSSNLWKGLYVGYGDIKLGQYNSYLGFFGATPIQRQYISSTATVSDLITKLKNYGLFN